MYVFKESIEKYYNVFAEYGITIYKDDRVLSQKEIDVLRDQLFKMNQDKVINFDVPIEKELKKF